LDPICQNFQREVQEQGKGASKPGEQAPPQEAKKPKKKRKKVKVSL
jgi:hypothetical protein